MNFKEFLELTVEKMILTILFFFTSVMLGFDLEMGTWLGGFPLNIFKGENTPFNKYSLFASIVDILFWYLISCIITYLFYRRFKKKKEILVKVNNKWKLKDRIM